MDEQSPNKKIKFSPSNIEQYESEFMHKHNIAMGYEPRPEPVIQQAESITELAMIAVYRRAIFDCFLPPAWLCECDKCQRWRETEDKFTDLYEETMDGISLTSVAHVFLEMPSNGSFEASTPKFSIPTYVACQTKERSLRKKDGLL